MNSKKQSIAPTIPPEDTRPKIDESLVDHTSIMKAAIPVLPVGLAWFCLICNCLIPGFGMFNYFIVAFCFIINKNKSTNFNFSYSRYNLFWNILLMFWYTKIFTA